MGAAAFDVAKMLGDTVQTIDEHYAPSVKELRERARRIMQNGEAIEKLDCTIITQQPSEKGRSNETD